jgi:hypothetical protein
MESFSINVYFLAFFMQRFAFLHFAGVGHPLHGLNIGGFLDVVFFFA